MMFTAFDRDRLFELRGYIENLQGGRTYTSSPASSIHLTYEADLPSHFFLALSKDRESSSFLLKQTKHIISIDKADASLDEILENEVVDIVSGPFVYLVESLKNLEEYKSKSGTSLIVPCLLDVDSYCPICNFLQSLRTIASYDLSSVQVSGKEEDRYEVVKVLHQFAERCLQFIFKIENYVFPGLLVDFESNNSQITGVLTNKDFLNEVTSKFLERATEEGISLIDLDYLGFEITGQKVDSFNYKVETVKVYIGDEVSQKIEELNLPSNIKNEFFAQGYFNSIKAILRKRALENTDKIIQDFSPLFDNTIEMILDKAKKYLDMLE